VGDAMARRDHPCAQLDSSKMDPNFLTGLFDAQPQLAVGTESFGQKMLVYHRGMGMVSKHGRFVAAKVRV
jgi:hypothetical protein